jgi:hypothetical protein
VKCPKHELRPGEVADSPRYTRAMREQYRCWRCRLLAIMAHVKCWVDTNIGLWM